MKLGNSEYAVLGDDYYVILVYQPRGGESLAEKHPRGIFSQCGQNPLHLFILAFRPDDYFRLFDGIVLNES